MKWKFFVTLQKYLLLLLINSMHPRSINYFLQSFVQCEQSDITPDKTKYKN